jgi:tetratricopeptide (TPR) repeat protein
LSIAEKIGEKPLISLAYGNLGVLGVRTGNLNDAEANFRRSFRRDMDRVTESILSSYLVVTLLEQGKLSEANQVLSQSLTAGRSLHVDPCTGLSLVVLGQLRYYQSIIMTFDATDNNKKAKILIKARRTLLRALALDGVELETRVEGRIILASVLLEQKQVNLAQEQVKLAFEEANASGLTRLVALAQKIQGDIYSFLQDYDEAKNIYEQALSVMRKIGMRLEYARTLTNYALMFLNKNYCKDHTGVKQGIKYLQEAKQIYNECGATVDIRIVEAHLSRYDLAIKQA